ncbi:uncharacterized protein BYT42DRAFT_366770 [Radiomyces spectabilis]|uniref:uncharacterized protein n=1 Tax=Radiomyces spectabilis TaxID=64574 RepID=UPI00221FD7EB|nr:uncharacterized protein BYT42DRAFT_366770 [Radiomyces spectabilis]KAI8378078.1 hypothetical protein BYT42DRAFT_366770 [Radiomyces spectabilis]
MLSNVRWSLPMDNKLVHHTPYSVNWLKTFANSYLKNQRKGSIRLLMQHGINTDHNISDLLDELKYRNIAEIMDLHIANTNASLIERIKCEEKGCGFNVVTNLLKASSLKTTSTLSSGLAPYYQFITLMDYFLFRMQPENVPYARRFWTNRTEYNKSDLLELGRMKFTQMTFSLVNMVCGFPSHLALTQSTWPHHILKDDLHDIFTNIIKPYEAEWTTVFPRHNNLAADQHNYT